MAHHERPIHEGVSDPDWADAPDSSALDVNVSGSIAS